MLGEGARKAPVCCMRTDGRKFIQRIGIAPAGVAGWPERPVRQSLFTDRLELANLLARPRGAAGCKDALLFLGEDHPIFGWVGLLRESAEGGAVYSGAMTDCNEAIRPNHDRLRELLMPKEYERWFRGRSDDLFCFQNRCLPNTLIAVHRAEFWSRTSKAAKA